MECIGHPQNNFGGDPTVGNYGSTWGLGFPSVGGHTLIVSAKNLSPGRNYIPWIIQTSSKKNQGHSFSGSFRIPMCSSSPPQNDKSALLWPWTCRYHDTLKRRSTDVVGGGLRGNPEASVGHRSRFLEIIWRES